VVHRRKQRAGHACSERRAKKGGPADEPEDHALGRSRGGLTTKFHLITDGGGLPLAVGVSAGQCHDSTRFEDTMRAARLVSTRWPPYVAGDKAYSNNRIRSWVAERSIEPVIARPSNQRVTGAKDEFDRDTYKRRNVIERCIGWLKECRRIATRFEKLAVNFVSMLKVAMLQRYLRLLD
jgi:transposase